MKSKEGYLFKDLISIIIDDKNIALAYRNIKSNKGSKTPGVNETTIKDIHKYEMSEWIGYIKERFEDFKPMPVRRVEIEKLGGGLRPLGIPIIEDRMVQQCIKQVLEPIAEAKFYHGSYGFRPDKSAENAIAKVMQLININKLHYAIDIDIKGFFDNINHGKLLKQMWTMGIQDYKLIAIISEMLKAEIEGIGIPTKGVPQGGIVSTLLSNIVLNELDWWIHSQWEGMKTKKYSTQQNKIQALKQTNLKEMYIVRYADDFKILTNNYVSAQKIFIAVTQWLKERLKLDISAEKSMVINLRKNYSNFLGFKLKAVKKKKKYVVKSMISDKAKSKLIQNYSNQIEKIRNNPKTYNVEKLNSMILGWHNYYKIATHVNSDFSEINFLVRKRLFNRTRSIRSDSLYENKTYKRIYGNYNFKPISICKITIYPLAGVKFKIPRLMKMVASRYTIVGRFHIHKDLDEEFKESIKLLINNPLKNQSIQKNDNRISIFVAQRGLCHVSKEKLDINGMEIRNIVPEEKGGTDQYYNLILVDEEISRFIDETNELKINEYKERIKLNRKALKKINKLRKLVGNSMI
ncbi:group II intron reverse transcriptase/maturase [Clostridium sp.]|uniref:group II intron reverse transcriptase/maturase n=1 Tax=Clostridium sp. TaxID=1506 RepID=UPI00284A30FA|nr:group II intron reverse transcriptase/maturase [Clostridium sp.]MDR3595673.1 group II intron reverse transcriptase/maturase [Clostridium sp.]